MKPIRFALALAALLVATPAAAQFFGPGALPTCTFAPGPLQLSNGTDPLRVCGVPEQGALAAIIDSTGIAECSNVPLATGGGAESQLVQWDASLGAGGEWKCIGTDALPGGGDLDCTTTPGTCVLLNADTDNLCIGDTQGQQPGDCGLLLNASGLIACNVPGACFTTTPPLTGPDGEWWALCESQDQPGNECLTLKVTGDVAASADIDLSGLLPTGVTPGSYTSADITVNANGKVTAAADGSGGGGGFSGVWEYAIGTTCPVEAPPVGGWNVDNTVWPLQDATTLCVDSTDSDGANRDFDLSLLRAGGQVTLREGSSTLVFDVSGLGVQVLGYWQIPVVYRGSDGAAFTAADQAFELSPGTGRTGFTSVAPLVPDYAAFPTVGQWAGQTLLVGPFGVPAGASYDVSISATIMLADPVADTPGTFGFRARAYTTDVDDANTYQYAGPTGESAFCFATLEAVTEALHRVSCELSGLQVGISSVDAADPVWLWLEMSASGSPGEFKLPGPGDFTQPGVHSPSGGAQGTDNYLRSSLRVMVHP